MAKAYKCDLCGKYSDNCYRVSGIDIYPSDLLKIGVDKSTKIYINELCKDCYEKIMDIATELFRKGQSTNTE